MDGDDENKALDILASAAVISTDKNSLEESGNEACISSSPSTRNPIENRVSCHRCGNIRKKRTSCIREGCPHIFCGRCAEKLREEHGELIFSEGCPVCLELCCCAVKTAHCIRINHCYRKCPVTRQPKSNASKRPRSESGPDDTTETDSANDVGGFLHPRDQNDVSVIADSMPGFRLQANYAGLGSASDFVAQSQENLYLLHQLHMHLSNFTATKNNHAPSVGDLSSLPSPFPSFFPPEGNHGQVIDSSNPQHPSFVDLAGFYRPGYNNMGQPYMYYPPSHNILGNITLMSDASMYASALHFATMRSADVNISHASMLSPYHMDSSSSETLVHPAAYDDGYWPRSPSFIRADENTPDRSRHEVALDAGQESSADRSKRSRSSDKIKASSSDSVFE